MMRRLRYLWRAFNYAWRVTPREVAFLSECLRPGDAAVDIGAHKGGFLYWLRRHVAASGRVYGFEPQPELARYLKDIVAMQRWRNVTIESAGVSARSGEMELFVPTVDGAPSPGATLAPVDRAVPHHSLSVPVVSLDEYFRGQGDPRVAFIKCDCEGHELDVFRGAERLLRRDRPVLLFECEQRHLPGGSPASVFAYLEQLGYRGRFFGPNGLTPVEQFRVALHQRERPGRYWDVKDYYNNFVFLPEGSDRA